MGLFRLLRSNSEPKEVHMFHFFSSKTPELLPWEGKQSIYQFILERLNNEGKIPASPDYDNLPDDNAFFDGKPLRWVAGAEILGLGSSPRSASAQVQKIIRMIRKQTEKPTSKNRRNLYLALVNEAIYSYIDDLLAALSHEPNLRIPELIKEAKWLVKNAAHREPVKFGIAIIGVLGVREELSTIIMLGKHEEFALYAVVALNNMSDDRNPCLCELAKSLHGWGKISVVSKLEPTTDEIKQWLLRHGCSNAIMENELAYICATKGDMHIVLEASDIDVELYKGTGVIITALISGGPAEGIDDYEFAATVIQHYIRHSKIHAMDLQDFLSVADILSYLNEEDEWPGRYEKGWNVSSKETSRKDCLEIIQLYRWPHLVHSSIMSENSVEEYCAIRSAQELGIDIWKPLFNKLQLNPLEQGLYYHLMQMANKERVEELVEFAEKNLPLQEITSKPFSSDGFGPGYEVYSCLDFILQDLRQYEGLGSSIVITGLRSPVTRNRNIALQVLDAWSRDKWPDEAESFLKVMSKSDPYPDARKTATELLLKDISR